MSKTKSDIVNLALRQIGVVAVDEPAQADDIKVWGDVLDAEFARIQVTEDFTWTFTTDTVPDALYEPFSRYLASFMTMYNRPLPARRAAMADIRAHELPDDRTDRADANTDGTLSAAETAVADRATFY